MIATAAITLAPSHISYESALATGVNGPFTPNAGNDDLPGTY